MVRMARLDAPQCHARRSASPGRCSLVHALAPTLAFAIDEVCLPLAHARQPRLSLRHRAALHIDHRGGRAG
jgi:hypothetical protein